MIISTVLGSCVAVCLFCAMPQAAAMCHCVLPWRTPGSGPDPVGYYVDETVQHMVAMMRKRGAVAGCTPGAHGPCSSEARACMRGRGLARAVTASGH